MLCIDFVSFLRGQIFREFQNIEKFVTFWKSMNLKKECIAMFPTLTLIETGRKRLDLIKKTAFLLAFKETGSGAISIGSVRNLHHQRTSVRSSQALQS